MTESVKINERVMCWGCHRPQKSCWCFLVKAFDTHTRFVILMHPMEAKKEPIGTGRMAHRFLKNSRLIVGLDFNLDSEFLDAFNDPQYQSVLLYPGRNALSLATSNRNTITKPMQIFVIDGTWPCAKKMLKINTLLHQLPLVSFDIKSESQFLIKQQPKKFCLSTIEAIYYCLVELNSAQIECVSSPQDLLLGLKFLVDYQIKCSLDPTLPSYRKSSYRPVEDRDPSKKWSKRSLFLNL